MTFVFDPGGGGGGGGGLTGGAATAIVNQLDNERIKLRAAADVGNPPTAAEWADPTDGDVIALAYDDNTLELWQNAGGGVGGWPATPNYTLSPTSGGNVVRFVAGVPAGALGTVGDTAIRTDNAGLGLFYEKTAATTWTQRVDLGPSLNAWTTGNQYRAGQFITNGGSYYLVTANHTAPGAFDGANLQELGAGGAQVSAGTAIAAGGVDDDFHIRHDTTANTLVYAKRIAGTWTTQLTVPLRSASARYAADTTDRDAQFAAGLIAGDHIIVPGLGSYVLLTDYTGTFAGATQGTEYEFVAEPTGSTPTVRITKAGHGLTLGQAVHYERDLSDVVATHSDENRYNGVVCNVVDANNVDVCVPFAGQFTWPAHGFTDDEFLHLGTQAQGGGWQTNAVGAVPIAGLVVIDANTVLPIAIPRGVGIVVDVTADMVNDEQFYRLTQNDPSVNPVAQQGLYYRTGGVNVFLHSL